MVTKTQLETLWNIPDELWALIAPVLGPEKAAGTVGRPARSNRQIFDGILYVLRTGCQWHALPRKLYGPASTVHARFSKWVRSGVFFQAWQQVLIDYDKTVGINWKWQALDGAITKRSVLTDPAGSPLWIVVTAANAHDKTIALETLYGIVVERPEKRVYRLHHLSLLQRLR